MTGPTRRSTLYLRGASALTLAEIQAFVLELRMRPRRRLIGDLPELLALTESKFQLVRTTLAHRVREFDEGERSELVESLAGVVGAASEVAVRDRAARLLAEVERLLHS